MTSKLSILGAVVKREVNGLKDELFGSSSDSEKKEVSPEEVQKAKLEEEKREEARRQYEEERRKRFEKEEYQREKKRQAIREKYGIQKKGASVVKPDNQTIEAVKDEFNMTEEEYREFKDKVNEDNAQKERAEKKIEKKLHVRQQKKELKKGFEDTCKTQ